MNRCCVCGDEAVARLNGFWYLCMKHADDVTLQSLNQGKSVLMAANGSPEYMIMPKFNPN